MGTNPASADECVCVLTYLYVCEINYLVLVWAKLWGQLCVCVYMCVLSAHLGGITHKFELSSCSRVVYNLNSPGAAAGVVCVCMRVFVRTE
jgi:hypothetical protein